MKQIQTLTLMELTFSVKETDVSKIKSKLLSPLESNRHKRENMFISSYLLEPWRMQHFLAMGYVCLLDDMMLLF